MRLAHFVQRYPPALGGSEAYFARLSRYLAKQGDTVTVFTTNAIDLEAFWSPRGRSLAAGSAIEDGVTVTRFQPRLRFPGRRYPMKALSLLPLRFWQCLTMTCNPITWGMWRDSAVTGRATDVVHATAFPYAWPIACALRLARRNRIPFLLTPFLHLGDPDDPNDPTRRQYTTPALMYLIQEADRVFVQTCVEQAALVERGIAPEKLVLLGMGADPAECTGGDRDRARLQWNVAAAEVVVGHLANNSIEKGTVDLLQAAEKAWAAGKRFVLVLAGPQMPNFLRFWAKFGPKEQVRLLGPLTDEQKRDFFAGIDLFALPSRSDSFGLVLLEAWLNGVPSVAYRAGGIAAVIRHGEDGLLVQCGDISGLAAALVRLLDDRDLRRLLGTAGRDRTVAEFRWEDKLVRVRRVYEEVCRSGCR